MIYTHDGAIIGDRGAVAATTAPAIPAEQALRARAAYAALPDIRLDKVREVRRRMAAGKFNPSAGDLADAILAFADNTRRCR